MNPSKLIGNFPEVLSFDQLFLKFMPLDHTKLYV